MSGEDSRGERKVIQVGDSIIDRGRMNCGRGDRKDKDAENYNTKAHDDDDDDDA